MRFPSPIPLVACLALTASACSTTFGPVVRDIHSDGNGQLLVDMCNVEIGYRAQSADMVDCVTKAIQVVPAPPPHG